MNYKVTDTELTATADAIRNKGGTSATIEWVSGEGFADAIETLPDEVTMVAKSITANGTYDPSDDSADGYSSVTVNVSGGGSFTFLSGTEAPDDTTGEDGDFYIWYSKAYIINDSISYINTGYNGNDNSEYKIELCFEENQTYQYPTPFGARSDTGSVTNASYFHLQTSNNFVSWGSTENRNVFSFFPAVKPNIDITLELKAGTAILSYQDEEETYTWTPTSISSTTPVGLFALLINGTPLGVTYTNKMRLYSFKIYESSVLIHDYVPVEDGDGLACIYDNIDQVYLYGNDTSAFSYHDAGVIKGFYRKINGSWENVYYSDVEDIIS